MSILHIISANLDTMFDQVMAHLSNEYHNRPSELPDLPLSPEHEAGIAYGQSACQHQADCHFSQGGHTWTTDSVGNISHCDGVPIGNCVF